MTTLSIDRHDSITATAPSRLISALTSTTDSVALTALRIALGAVILPHGLQKTVGLFGGYGFEATMGWFGSMGIPPFLGFLAILAESAGAVALIAGFGARIAAFGIGVTLAVAGATHAANGFFMNWSGKQAGEGFEFHILAAGMALALVIGGAGRLSLDRVINRKVQ